MRTNAMNLMWVAVVLLMGRGTRDMAQAHVLILPPELRSSDGCGPNPLSIVLTAANDLGHMAASEVMAVLESDPETWGDFINLIHTYDDCIRAGQLRYKRRAPGSPRGSSELSQVQNALNSALRLPTSLPSPSVYRYGHYVTKGPRGSAAASLRPSLLQKFLRQEEEPFVSRDTPSH